MARNAVDNVTSAGELLWKARGKRASAFFGVDATFLTLSCHFARIMAVPTAIGRKDSP